MAIALDKDVVFNPISFENFVAPFQIYKQAYDQVEAKYDELSKAAQLEFQMASDQDKNSKAYETYKAYMDGLNEAVADFSTGMTLQNRTALGNFKRRYSSDIVPVENALKRRLELSEEQRKMAQQDRTLVFEKDAKDLDLDDIIANPAIGYGKSFSGKEVAAYAANMAKTLQKVCGDMYVAGDLTSNELQTIKKIITTKGIDLDSLNTFLDNPDNRNHKYYKKLAPIMENIYEITGVRSWEGYNDDDYYLLLKPYLTQGMQDAIGDRSYNTVTLNNPKPTGGDGGKGGAEDSSSLYTNVFNILLSNKYNNLKDKLEKVGLFKNGKLAKSAKDYLGSLEKTKEVIYASSPSTNAPYIINGANDPYKLLDDLLEYVQQYKNLVHWNSGKKGSKVKQGKIAFSDIEELLNNSVDFQKTGTQYLVPQRTNIDPGSNKNIITNLETDDSDGQKVPTYEVDMDETNTNNSMTMKLTTQHIKRSNIKENDIQRVFVAKNGVFVQLTNNKIVKISPDTHPQIYKNLTSDYSKWTKSANNEKVLLDYDNLIQQGITNLLGSVEAKTLAQSQNYE